MSKDANMKRLVKMVTVTRERVTACLSTETNLADELFGRDAAFDPAARSIRDLHAALVKAWSKSEGKRAEVLWLAKDRAETMRNTVIVGRVIRDTFFADLDTIDAALSTCG